MPFQIVRNDITNMQVDAIINAANSSLQMGGGVCGAIFAEAGAEKLQEECDRIGKCYVGQAVITGGYNLPAKYIIHTVGPIWKGGNSGEEQLLRNCYINSLSLALKHKCKSVAFPLISSGIYGYPKDLALQAAVSAIGEFLFKHEMIVYLVVYDRKTFVLSGKLFSAIEKYIDENYVEERRFYERRGNMQPYEAMQMLDMSRTPEFFTPISTKEAVGSLEDILGKLDEPFSKMLLRLIDMKGMTDVETYKRANIDRKLFSKIRSNKGYNPSKATAIAFAIALRLKLDETLDLLGSSGYTLSQSSRLDVIVKFFICAGDYDIHKINGMLFAFNEKLLGE